jgi:phage terminase large subunit-like protein
VSGWEAKYRRMLKVKATERHPCEWWMTGGRAGMIARALEVFHTAVVEGELTHDGGYVLTRHVLNARRKPTSSGIHIAKEHPDSVRKIDAAVAAVLAWRARVDAVAAGVGGKVQSFTPRRVY